MTAPDAKKQYYSPEGLARIPRPFRGRSVGSLFHLWQAGNTTAGEYLRQKAESGDEEAKLLWEHPELDE